MPSFTDLLVRTQHLGRLLQRNSLFSLHLLREHDGDAGWGGGLPRRLPGWRVLDEVSNILVFHTHFHLLVEICIAV